MMRLSKITDEMIAVAVPFLKPLVANSMGERTIDQQSQKAIYDQMHGFFGVFAQADRICAKASADADQPNVSAWRKASSL